ncbi:hypothetical protein EYZ11_009326 [Aspergillus tanneri]|uniref:Uncharacterized protein n=1 Tax=Aspergillus tanneri TaxID=1220188 RepID=A0A4S3J8L3_9EURO|nr:uncharacterized protein ATNIH1004_006859 [Aspergillus tanneri]KAA8645440.1 hypothetical protein ATNIH1004_006859 [Aspergillus tanneri]THC91222.1 hypothetical protein EYZ11_009326 [Aspergillus tanneri]
MGSPQRQTLRLNLKDFTTVDLTESYRGLYNQEIVISLKQFYGFLSRAKLRQETGKRHIGFTNHARRGIQKCRRPAAPDSDTQSEELEIKRRRYNDNEYYPSDI